MDIFAPRRLPARGAELVHRRADLLGVAARHDVRGGRPQEAQVPREVELRVRERLGEAVSKAQAARDVHAADERDVREAHVWSTTELACTHVTLTIVVRKLPRFVYFCSTADMHTALEYVTRPQCASSSQSYHSLLLMPFSVMFTTAYSQFFSGAACVHSKAVRCSVSAEAGSRAKGASQASLRP